nr:unnamed protein product [Spirometra erinaceieuropaei]
MLRKSESLRDFLNVDKGRVRDPSPKCKRDVGNESKMTKLSRTPYRPTEVITPRKSPTCQETFKWVTTPRDPNSRRLTLPQVPLAPSGPTTVGILDRVKADSTARGTRQFLTAPNTATGPANIRNYSTGQPTWTTVENFVHLPVAAISPQDTRGRLRTQTGKKCPRSARTSQTFDSLLNCSDRHFIDFITKCLRWIPEDRLTPRDAFHHPWILEESQEGIGLPRTASPTMPNTRSTSDAHSSSIDQLTVALGNLLTRTSPVALDSPRPPIYEVGDSFSDWRVQAERHLVHLPADQRMDHITGLLGPTAKRRLNYLCVSPPTTISNLWASLESLFGAQEPLIALHNEFCLRTQLPGENADSYLDALFSLGSRVFPDSQVSDQVFLRFVGGLRSEDIKREFRIRPPANLLTALQTTRIFESAPPQQEPPVLLAVPRGNSDYPIEDRLSLVRPTTRTIAGTASSLRIVLASAVTTTLPLVTADGSPLRCTGTRQVSIVLPICTAVHPMLVSPDIRVDAIVGLDFLRAHQLIIDPNNPAAVLLSRSAISNISVDVSTLDTTPSNEPTSIDDLLIRQEIPVTYLRRLKDTLFPFQSVFTWAGQPIGRTGLVQHAINTGTAAPQRQPARRIPIHYQTELNSIISDLRARLVSDPAY